MSPSLITRIAYWSLESPRPRRDRTHRQFEGLGDGVKLGYVKNARNLTWVESAQACGLDEVILLDEHGQVAECTSANMFASTGGEVWTPPIDSGCLPGIAREVLLSEIYVPRFARTGGRRRGLDHPDYCYQCRKLKAGGSAVHR